MKVLFVWRSGLKFYELFENRPHAIYDPKNNEFLYGSVSPEEEVLIVDDETASGMTLFTVISNLKLKNFRIATWDMEGTFKPDILLPPPKLRKPFITFFGLPACGKSFVAYSLSKALGVPVIKWGKLAEPYAGSYGEKLAEIERKDPFFIARKAYRFVKEKGLQDEIFILDNPKNELQLTFFSFSLRKPAIPICVEVDESLRQEVLHIRVDKDDAFAKERDKLFMDGFEKMKKRAVTVRLDSNDHSEAIFLLKRHGLYEEKGFYPNTLFYKPAILDFIFKVSTDERIYKENPLGRVPKHYTEHYLKRYTQFISEPRRKNIALMLSIAYRIVDDILDEHDTRLSYPSYHSEKSIFEAIFLSSLLILHAKYLLKGEEKEEYLKMVKKLYEAVSLELSLEIEGRKPTREEYLKTLEREGAFRAFLYFLAGKDPKEGWKRGIEAQIKDDLFGAEKYGRGNTEAKLNRPARFAKDFSSLY